MRFRDFSWSSFMAIVDILKHGGIITKIIYHVLLVTGCRLAPPVVIGLKVYGFLGIREEYTPQESQWWLRRDTTKRDRLFQICLIILLMGAPPHRAVLPGIGPIWVASLWVLKVPRVSPPVNRSTRHQSTGQPVWAKFHQSTRHRSPDTRHRLPASVAQLDAPSDWRPGGRGFNPRRGRQHSFVEVDHEIFSTVILSLLLIQEG